MKKTIKVGLATLILFIILTFCIVMFIFKNNSTLNNFKFISVTNTGLNFYIYFEEVKSANKYDIIIYDNSDNIINKKTVKNNSATISLKDLVYGSDYKIIVIAFDKNENQKSIKKPYTFTWNELSFSSSNNVLVNNENDYIINFDGDWSKKNYKLKISMDNTILKTIDIKSLSYTISNSLFKDKKTHIKLEIIDNSLVISTLDIYNLMSPISDIVITNPNNGDILSYNDVALSFEGGDNASNYLLELYCNNILIRRKEINDKTVILSSNLFDKASSYKIKITASYYDYIDYSKTSEVSFNIDSKETLKPVYTNYNFKNIEKGTKIELFNSDKLATIYYTLDGTDPSENGIKYSGAIEINEDTILKTYAKEDKKNDSVVSTYNFKIGKKNKYKVYLSASNQYNNLGVSSVGYTNEKKEMNDLSDFIQKRLESYNVTVYRNEYGDINRWTKDSNYLGVDLHLAIHSNASLDHSVYGIETWINNEDSLTYSLAQKIQNNLIDIYYKKEDPLANRGVKYAAGSLAEVNPSYVPFGILIEVAHHDYESDAQWIMENKMEIGYSIADSILEYFQIK